MSGKDYLIYFVLALGTTLPVVYLVRELARRFDLVARPRVDRWHKRPTALFGGVAMFVGFSVVVVLYPPPDFSGDNLLLLCSAGMFVLGLVDDRVRLKPYAKLVGQIVFSTAFTVFGTRLHWLEFTVLDQALTIFWLVGIANAVNLLDNLDGLAGGVAAIAAFYLVYLCHAAGQAPAAALAAAFAGAVVAFLFFNFNPASIFMGDCGSLFLGFFLGGLTLVSNQVEASAGLRRNILAVLAVPVLLLLIPIVDTTLVTITRKFHGRPVSQGGRDHTSHRLVALGLSERKAALVLWALAAASGAFAVFVSQLDWPVAILLLPVFGIVVLFFLVHLGRVKVYQRVVTPIEGLSPPETPANRAFLPTLTDFAYKRRVFEVLHDVLIIVLVYYAAYLLRFDGELVEPFYGRLLESLPVVIAVQMSAFLALGLYRGLWRYTSMSDLSTLLRAVGGAWLSTVVVLFLLFRLEGFSRGVLVMDGVLLCMAITGSRIGFRLLRTYLGRLQGTAAGRKVLIYGAGDGGELLVRELQNNFHLGLTPVGFVDDDPQKHGRVIHGVRVLGPVERLGDLANRTGADEIVISTDKIDSGRVATLGQVTETQGLRTRRMRIALD